MIKLIITGNVISDTEVHQDKDGGTFATFKLLTKSSNKDKSKHENIEISCNGRLVELAKNSIRKGAKVFVDGYPTFNAFINHDNTCFCNIRLYAHIIELMGNSQLENNTDKMNITNCEIIPKSLFNLRSIS